jgi:hypothetical protein
MKIIFPECHALALGEEALFPECRLLALGEGASSPSVTQKHSWKYFYFFSLFCSIFCDALPHYLKLFAQVWFNFEFLGIFC